MKREIYRVIISMRSVFLPKGIRKTELTSIAYDYDNYLDVEQDKINLHNDLCVIGDDLRKALSSCYKEFNIQL